MHIDENDIVVTEGTVTESLCATNTWCWNVTPLPDEPYTYRSHRRPPTPKEKFLRWLYALTFVAALAAMIKDPWSPLVWVLVLFAFSTVVKELMR